jgi:hypothetical protein
MIEPQPSTLLYCFQVPSYIKSENRSYELCQGVLDLWPTSTCGTDPARPVWNRASKEASEDWWNDIIVYVIQLGRHTLSVIRACSSLSILFPQARVLLHSYNTSCCRYCHVTVYTALDNVKPWLSVRTHDELKAVTSQVQPRTSQRNKQTVSWKLSNATDHLTDGLWISSLVLHYGRTSKELLWRILQVIEHNYFKSIHWIAG